MVPNLLFYQLLLVALVLICILVRVWWPGCPSVTPQTPRQPGKPRRKRSKEPKPFTGYLHKPLCEACEQGTDPSPKAPESPPPVRLFTRGRRRTVDTSGHFCLDHDCSYHGWLGRGHSRSNGHPGGHPWRQLQWVSCQGYFDETHGTIFHGKPSSPELIGHLIACLAEGLGIRGTARVFEIDANTVLNGLMAAAEQLKAFSAYFLNKLPINQVQLDELYAVLRAVRDGDISEAEAVEQLSQSPRWVWTAIDPESKLWLSAQVGPRTLAMAQAMLHQIAQMVAPGCVPLFLSDGNPNYLPAIVSHFGHWVQPPRRQVKGSAPKPRWRPLPELLYAQVVKKMRRRRIVEVRVAATRRRSATSCKGEAGLGHQLARFHAYHNFVLPHASLRQALEEPIPTNGGGSAKQWRPCTPAMAAGLTDHVGSLQEVLLYPVPSWPQAPPV